MTYPSILPPMCDSSDGHLLLDGCFVNNLPGLHSLLMVCVFGGTGNLPNRPQIHRWLCIHKPSFTGLSSAESLICLLLLITEIINDGMCFYACVLRLFRHRNRDLSPSYISL